MPRSPGKRENLWAQVGFYSSLGFILPAAALVGVAGGWYLDGWLHTSPLFTIAAGFAGAAAGLIEVLRILHRAEDDASGDGDDSRGANGPR